MSRGEERPGRRVTVVRRPRPPAWQAPVIGRTGGDSTKAAASATRSVPGWLRRLIVWLPQTLAGRVAAAVAAVALFTGTTWVTTHCALLDIDHIEVSGGTAVTPEEAAAGAGLRRGQPMTSVDAATAERRLLRLPWVDTAVVDRAFPNIVRIRLTERVAAASAARPAGGWVLLDPTGRVLAERPDRPAGLPEIIGAGATPPPAVTLASGRPALDVIAALPEFIRSQLTGVTLNGEAVSLQAGERAIHIGPPTSLAAKVAALGVLLERVGGRSVAVLDVRVPQAPVVVPVALNVPSDASPPGREAADSPSGAKPRD